MGFSVRAFIFISVAGTIPVRSQDQAPAPIPCVINEVAQTVAASGDKTIDTSNIQNAINTCGPVGAAASRPVYVRLLPGNYVIAPITLQSWVYLLMPEGVVLNASTVTTDYQIPGKGTCGTIASSSTGCNPLISSSSANNIGIIGSRGGGKMGGTIEGHGWDVTSGNPSPYTGMSWWAIADLADSQGKKQICPRLIEFDQGTNIMLRDITIQNSPYFHVVFSQDTQVTARHLAIQSPTPDHPSTARNTDGIDPISSTFVSITNNHIISGDDDIAITAATKGSSHDITIQNNHFDAGHGLSIGSGTADGVYNVYVKYAFFNGTDNGIRLKSDSSGGGEVHHLYYNTVCMKAINTNPSSVNSLSSKNGAIVLDTQYSSSTGTSYPYFHDIHFHDVFSDTESATVNGTPWDHVRLNGADSLTTQPIGQLSFFNVDFTEPTTASPATIIDPATILLYSNSSNLTIPGVAVTPASVIDPDFNGPANRNIGGFCRLFNSRTR
jgi:polygalacturonase